MKLRVKMTMEWVEDIKRSDVSEMIGYAECPPSSEWVAVLKKHVESNIFYAAQMGQDSMKVTIHKIK